LSSIIVLYLIWHKNKDFSSLANARLFKGTSNTKSVSVAYNKAISLNPKYAVAYYNRGLLKKDQLKDRQGAIGDLCTAARIFCELECQSVN
jgi:tetratricopeptide (TPR) repeat protein